MRYLTVFLVICTMSLTSFAQTSFILTDSVVYHGLKMFDNGSIKNAIQCEAVINKKSRIFSPYEVKEYGLGNGRVYVSKDIQIDDSIKRVFLLQLVKDTTNLYVYNAKKTKLYYIEKDSSFLIELSKYQKENKKADFRIDLLKITDDCQNIKDAIKHVTFTDRSLSKIITYYNKCSPKPFPYIKYGFLVGCGLRDLEIGGNYLYVYKNFVNNKYKSSILTGFFIDFPILMSNFSFHTDVYFSKFGYSLTHTSTSRCLDFVANTSSIHLPLLVRYTLPGMTLRPFVNGGLNGIYNLQNSTTVYVTLINPDYVELQSVDRKSYISKYQVGFSAGAGIEYILNYKHSVFIEFRYNKQLRTSDKNTFNNTQMELLTGINI